MRDCGIVAIIARYNNAIARGDRLAAKASLVAYDDHMASCRGCMKDDTA